MTTTLSPLARTYVEHFEHIDAGWRALNGDAAKLMLKLPDYMAYRGEVGVVGVRSGIERSWPLGRDDCNLVLRLIWNPDGEHELPWLDVMLDTKYDGVFVKRLIAEPGLSKVVPASLANDPLKECSELWRRGCDAVEEILKRPDVNERIRVMELLKQLEDELSEKEPGYWSDDGWPITLWWQNGARWKRSTVYWTIVYLPPNTNQAGHDSSSRLLLVLDTDDESVPPKLLDLLIGISNDEHDGCPVIVDLSEHLPEPSDEVPDVQKRAQKVKDAILLEEERVINLLRSTATHTTAKRRR